MATVQAQQGLTLIHIHVTANFRLCDDIKVSDRLSRVERGSSGLHFEYPNL